MRIGFEVDSRECDKPDWMRIQCVSRCPCERFFSQFSTCSAFEGGHSLIWTFPSLCANYTTKSLLCQISFIDELY